MEKKFQYAMVGAGLTLLVIAGIFALLISNARADRLPAQTVAAQTVTDDSIPKPVVQVMEDDPISNALNNQPTQNLPDLNDSRQLPLINSTDAEVVPAKDVGAAVLTRVAELNAQRMKTLLANGGGWLFIQTERYAPNSSNAPLPNGFALPTAQVWENWYSMGTNGLSDKSYTRMLNEEGTVVQESYFKDGVFYNDALGSSEESETKLSVAPDQGAYDLLRLDLEAGNELNGWVEETSDQVRYIATSTTYFEKPVEFGVSTAQVISKQYRFVYDLKDGSFLYGETIFVLESGEQTIWESVTQTAFEIVPEVDLPEQLVRYFFGN